ncbi:hypothetical protein BH10PLA2_BH10PLA2_22660 [soil metagenome]
MRKYLFMVAMFVTMGLTSPARAQQNISSSGNISGGQQQFQAVNFANSTLAAPVSTMPTKPAQASLWSSLMQKLPTPGFLKSTKAATPTTNPTTTTMKSLSSKTAAQYNKMMSRAPK